MNLPRTRWKRWTLGLVALAAVMLVGYEVARHYLWPAYKARHIQALNRDAKEFLDKGDVVNAILTARKSLQTSSANPVAWRIAAQAAALRSSTDALGYQQNLCRIEPTKENYFELVRLALRYDAPGIAVGALSEMAPQAKDDPVYYRLAADVYKKVGKPAIAQSFLIELTKLQPTDWNAQLELAELQLAADPAGKDAALRARIQALGLHPENRHRAATLLLQDKLARKSTEGTADLLVQLRDLPDLTVQEQLLIIEGEQSLHEPEAAARLARLQSAVADRPADVVAVIDYFVRTGAGAGVAPWVATLPKATQADEDVRARLGEILLAQRDWAGTVTYLSGPAWPHREYYRQTLLAYAYRAQGRGAQFNEAWNLALLEVGTDWRKMLDLFNKLQAWGWINEHYALIWKLFQLMPSNVELRNRLIVWERNHGNTANLNRIFARVVQVDESDRVARNNLAYTDLLLGANLARADATTAALVKAEPHNPYFLTTRAFALYLQNHPQEALALLEGLSYADLSEPVRMLLRAAILTRLGHVDQAADLLNGVVMRSMLPEEKRLADTTRLEIARLDRMQGDRSRLQAFRRIESPSDARGGWLAKVSPESRKAATDDMQLADSLYATGEWPALAELLHATQWQGQDYLRQALLAYVVREHGVAGDSRDSWNAALALANRDPFRVQNLRALAIGWKWPVERLETTDLVFERNPTDRLVLDELLDDYRAMRRTPDLMRVLGLYIANTNDTTDEAVAHAYYSLLLDINVNRAHVVARNAFEAAPADVMRRMVYAFSLWKQGRSAEAAPLIAAGPADGRSKVVPAALIRATIQAQLGNIPAAKESLARFDRDTALPEETALAGKVSGLLTSLSAVAPPRT